MTWLSSRFVCDCDTRRFNGGGTFHGQSIGSWENAKAVYFLSSAGPAVILLSLGVGLKMYFIPFQEGGTLGIQLNETLIWFLFRS